jgi:peptidyl-prolyl cis-trans isomerase C
MKIRKRVLSVVCAATVAACSQPAEQQQEQSFLGEASVGSINGVAIPESLFRRLGLNMIQKSAEDMSDDERAAVLDQLVAIELAAADGERRELQNERTIAAELELRRLQFLASAAVERYIEDNPPREAELRELYEERTANLSGTEYKARHILVETEEEAIGVIDQLNTGRDFAELAQEFSTGPTGPNGGDLGWFGPDRMVAPFSNAVQALEVGSYSKEPVQTQFGWHVILLEDTRDQQPPGIESMRTELTTLAQRRKIEAYLNSLRESAEVVIE